MDNAKLIGPERRSVVPRHPIVWIVCDLLRVAMNRGQIIEGAYLTQFACVDLSGVHVTDSHMNSRIFTVVSSLCSTSP